MKATIGQLEQLLSLAVAMAKKLPDTEQNEIIKHKVSVLTRKITEAKS